MYIRVIIFTSDLELTNSRRAVPSTRQVMAANVGVKATVSFYRVNSDTAFERHRSRIPINDLNTVYALKKHLIQFGSMPVLEEAKTMVYVSNHNMITMAIVIFKTYKMADKGEERKEY